MSGDSSEEKSQPASSKKLTDQRKKGKLAKAPDLLAAIITGALIGYVLLAAGQITGKLQDLITVSAHSIETDFNRGSRMVLADVQSTLLQCALPALLIAVTAAILGSMLINKGFLFSIEAVTPKLEKVNPVSGFKNIFKVNNLVEFGKSVVKAVLFGAALFALARGAINPLLQLPTCGPNCVPSVLYSLLMPLLLASVVFYFASGAVDLLIQKWLFMREMRMTKTEVKRENKDTNGNPLIKGQQRRLRREGAQDGVRTGFAHSTLIICAAEVAVGLRYVQNETPLPVVVCRAMDDASTRMIAASRARQLPIFWDKSLATELAAEVMVGKVITAKFFSRVVQAILQSRSTQPIQR